VNCEVEFLPASERSKAGDAIVIRYGDAFVTNAFVRRGGMVARHVVGSEVSCPTALNARVFG
jgi:hypothetical protein